MKLPVIAFDTVYHLGTLDPSKRGKEGGAVGGDSQEGHLLSVSTCPEAWRSIARLGGSDLHAMTLQEGGPALFFDIHALHAPEYADLREVIEGFGAEEGLTQSRQLWRTWSYDSEAYDPDADSDGAWRFMIFDTRDEALENANEESDDDPETTPAAEGHFEVEPVAMTVGTKKLETLVGCRLDRSECLDMVAIVWLEQVALPALEEGRGINTTTPALVGVWWNETYDPDGLSAPRGGVFPVAQKKLVTEVVADVEDEPHIGEDDEIRLGGFRSPGPR